MRSNTGESTRSFDQETLEPNNFDITNPFAVQKQQRGQIDNVVDYILADIFPDAMSDNLLILEQATEVAQATMPESLTCYPDSANLVDGTAINPDNTWRPPVDAPTKASGTGQTQTEKKLLTRPLKEWVNIMSPVATLWRITPDLSIDTDSLGSGFSGDQ